MNRVLCFPKIRVPGWGMLLVASLILLSGCGATPEEATISPDQARTSVAQTVVAAVSQTMVTSPTITQTPTLVPETTESTTATSDRPPLDLGEPTGNSPAPTSVPVAQSTSCDSAMFISDVTIPDGTDLDPESEFTKTWRLKNNGSCTWDSEYSFVYTSGDLLGASSSMNLGVDSVNPGESIDISVDMVSPDSAGTYTSYWQMQNASGVLFGDAVYVQIDVLEDLVTNTPTDTPTTTVSITDTPTATGTSLPTSTPGPTDTPTPVPTSTTLPSQTQISTDTPAPSNTPITTETSTP